MLVRFRRRVAAWTVALATVLLLVSATPAQATASPTGLQAVSTSTSAIGLTWRAVSGVSRYRVQYSTSSSMTNATYRRFSGTAGELGGLASGTTYYLKVRAITADGANLSDYSAAIKVRTRSAGDYPHLSPIGLAATVRSDTELALTWTARGAEGRYRLSWATTSDFSDPHYERVSGTKATLDGLKPGTTYYLKVRVITPDGGNLSSYSSAISAQTQPASPAPTPDAFSLAAPKGLAVSESVGTGLRIIWQAVSTAPRYRVQYATAATMAGASYLQSADTSLEIAGLSPGTTYYLKVRVISTAGANLSAYSAAISVKTPTEAATTYFSPVGLSADGQTDAKVTASWTSRGSGLSYEVQYADNSDFTEPQAERTGGTSTTLTGLQAATRYYLRVRVVTDSGTPNSAFSSAVRTSTTSATPAPLRVASYNVRCANCFAGLPNELTWYQRRDTVVATVLAQKPDVIGLQEASQGWLKDSAGKPVSLSQFEDLVNRLGSPYKLTNSHRNNCVKSTTPSNCTYADRGASQGVKIVYNSATLDLVDEGSLRLSEIDSSDNDRYVSWAILELKQSGKRFFFADTHLEPTADASGQSAYFNLRVKQTKETLAEVAKRNPDKLPTYIVGDFNSHKWTTPSNGPYDAMKAAGYVDPLGNTYRSTSVASGATVQRRIRTNVSSYNGFVRKAPSFSYLNATYLDYIWTSAGIAVPEWETVVNLDSAGNFVGVIPSDHNLLRADTVLP
ncbi:MAG: fibronectin type III domain-containing protein [Propionicimonas sp.]